MDKCRYALILCLRLIIYFIWVSLSGLRIVVMVTSPSEGLERNPVCFCFPLNWDDPDGCMHSVNISNPEVWCQGLKK